ncbi:MAG: YcbK family protein [Pararhizobium sp.]
MQTTGTVMMTAKDAAPDPIHTAAIQPAAAQAQKGEPTSPLARLFSSNQTGRAAPGISLLSPRNSQAASAAADDEASDEPDAAESDAHLQAASAVAGDDNALPGVHLHSIYEFGGSSNATGGVRPGEIQLASAAGAARLSPDFLVKQRDTVQTACLKPALLGLLRMVEYHFGKPVVITSGYRGPAHNAAVGGVRHSEHMKCEAADIQLDGVSKWDIARYVRSIPGRGGVGTYCHTDSVHVDIGEQRDWNWRCRRGH